MNNYLIWIDQHPVTVSEDIYKTYWKGRRKERYFTESDIHNHVFYYDALDTEETNGSDIFQDESCLPIEEQAIKNIEINKLHDALKQLPQKDYDLINRLYFYGESLRTISQKEHIALSTLHYKHKRILKKLREFIE
ncbi:MAG: sigma-70 family RNA polymerase sigma factor [Coprococcus sp.]|nr:sigma-70 family RNA polymerase sigma factor [Coprococcus sp.]